MERHDPTSALDWTLASTGSLLDEWTTTARAIVAEGMWCVIEACTDIADQRWEAALLICSTEEEAVTRELAAWIADFPAQDLRICGYTRDSLRRVDHSPRAICYLAGQS
jgi:hypothetical protein